MIQLLLCILLILFGQHRLAKAVLTGKYQQDRRRIEGAGWKGKGEALNAVRSAQSQEYQAAKDDLRREHKKKVRAARGMDEKALLDFGKKNATEPEHQEFLSLYEADLAKRQEKAQAEKPKRRHYALER